MRGNRLPVTISITRVPLANHPAPAVVDTADFEALLALGFSDQWHFGFREEGRRGYVYLNRWEPSRRQAVELSPARLIMMPRSGQIVRYRDKDLLNLRRSNLYLASGQSYGRERRFLQALLKQAEHEAEMRALSKPPPRIEAPSKTVLPL